MVEAVNSFGSGVAGLSALPTCPIHPCLPILLLTHSSLVSSLSPRFWGLLAPHAQVLGAFLVSRRFSSSPPRVAEHPRTANCVLPVVCASIDKNGAVFPHAGPPLSVPFLVGSDCLTTHRYSSVWGAHEELRAILLHPRLTVKGHSRFGCLTGYLGRFTRL